MQNECCCTDNCPAHCVTNDVESTNNENNNNGLSDDSEARVNADSVASQIQDDNNNNHNTNPHLQRYELIWTPLQ